MEVLQLTEEEAFVHPNNNIITRSLGNPSEKANPDIEGPIEVYQDDLFLLCSDGLCGVLPSRKIHEDISCIEDVIQEHVPDADHLIDGIHELWAAAAAAGMHDNVTILLCQVKTGLKRPEAKKKPKALQTNKSNTSAPPIASTSRPRNEENDKKRSRKDTIIALLVVALVFIVLGGGGAFYYLFYSGNKGEEVSEVQKMSEVDATTDSSFIDSSDKSMNLILLKKTAANSSSQRTPAKKPPVSDIVQENSSVSDNASSNDTPTTQKPPGTMTIPRKNHGATSSGDNSKLDTKEDLMERAKHEQQNSQKQTKTGTQ